MWPQQISWELQVPQRELNTETHVQSIKWYRRVAATKNWSLWNGCENILMVCTGHYWGGDPVIQFKLVSLLTAWSVVRDEGSFLQWWGMFLLPSWSENISVLRKWVKLRNTLNMCFRVGKNVPLKTQQFSTSYFGTGCVGSEQIVTLAFRRTCLSRTKKIFLWLALLCGLIKKITESQNGLGWKKP